MYMATDMHVVLTLMYIYWSTELCSIDGEHRHSNPKTVVKANKNVVVQPRHKFSENIRLNNVNDEWTEPRAAPALKKAVPFTSEVYTTSSAATGPYQNESTCKQYAHLSVVSRSGTFATGRVPACTRLLTMLWFIRLGPYRRTVESIGQ